MPPKNITAAAIDIAPPFTLQNFPPLPKIAPPRFGRLTQLKIAFDRCELPPAPSFDQQKVGITSSCSDEAPQSQSPAPSSTTERSAADRFVGTFELVEDVLSRLQLLDLLRARGTSTQFRDVVDKSSELQTILGLKPPQSALYSMPLLEAEAGNEDKDFDFYLKRVDWSALGNPVPPLSFSVSITFDTESFHPGSIARSMYISYPPLECIRLRSVCHCRKSEIQHRVGLDGSMRIDEDEYHIKVDASKPEGLTLGDLLDISERLRIKHVRCAWNHEDFKSIAGFRPSPFGVNLSSALSTESDAVVELQKLHEATYGAPPTSADDEIVPESRHNRIYRHEPARLALFTSLRMVNFTKIRFFDHGVIVIGSKGIEQWTDPTELLDHD